MCAQLEVLRCPPMPITTSTTVDNATATATVSAFKPASNSLSTRTSIPSSAASIVSASSASTMSSASSASSSVTTQGPCHPSTANTDQQQQQQTRKRRRSVSFFPMVQQFKALRQRPEPSQLWYNPTELAEFKHDAKAMEEAYSADNMGVSQKEWHGLRTCALDRHRHKVLAIQCTMSACRKGKAADSIASVAQKCSRYSKQLAFLQACYDHCNVYEPAYIQQLPSYSSVARRCPFPLRLRRQKRAASTNPNSASDTSDKQQQPPTSPSGQCSNQSYNSRCVRQRVC